MRIVIVGAGVGGLAVAMRLAALGHRVTVLEQAPAPGGKCSRVEVDGFRFDAGPSLLTLPDVARELFFETGASLDEEVELVRVEPVTRYRFADGSGFDMSADPTAAAAALEAWSPGAGADWLRFLATGEAMWRASQAYLGGLPPWPPRRPRGGERPPDPRDLLRLRPWQTLRGLARAHARDPRLRMVIERFATYAGGDPRRAPAVLALAGWVEHAHGAWHVRGGLHALVEAMVARLRALGGELETGVAVRALEERGGRVRAAVTDRGAVACDAVVFNGDEAALAGWLSPARPHGRVPERSLSGFALMLGLRGRTPDLAHHTILFPASYDAEFEDVFVHRRPVAEPTLYVSAASVSDATASPAGDEAWFVLVNAPTHGAGMDWDSEADTYHARVLGALAARGLDVGDRIAVRARRTPADLERETGAVGGAIYGRAPHGRLASLRRPGNAAYARRGVWLVGGTTHPGGGLPLVMLGSRTVAREIGPA